MASDREDILREILKFFKKIFESKRTSDGYNYAGYRQTWLEEIGLSHGSADEAKSAQTTKKLQEFLKQKFDSRVKIEAHVAEGMTLRFDDSTGKVPVTINSNKLQAFDILDVENGIAFEISLADAYAEFFKDVLKALLDARVKNYTFVCEIIITKKLKKVDTSKWRLLEWCANISHCADYISWKSS
ncbi:MAG: hypothetical protein HY884_05085 [Deltaproteobacteria bacterium]|nr:hypothetical protein [Deltaproteobacteria bacterium]